MNSLEKELREANIAYRKGEPVMSDAEYDAKLETLVDIDPYNKFLYEIGVYVDDSDPRKSKLPIVMASMNKNKTLEDLKSWIKNKNISSKEKMIISPKLDGLSFCVNETDESEAYTRGDGEYGQSSLEHYKKIKNKSINNLASELNTDDNVYSYGEVIIPRKIFDEKYSHYSNPRNLASGQVIAKEISPILEDCVYIRYGLVTNKNYFKTKSELFDFLNSNQEIKIPYMILSIDDIINFGGEEHLKTVFDNWNTSFEIDGLIIEVNDLNLQEKIGRETTSNNPAYARAYKGAFEEVKQSEVISITWNVSKQGYLKPIITINPLSLNGVNVTNVTGNNARYILNNKISKGALLSIKRSGMVIPFIVSVDKQSDFTLISTCPSCKSELKWNESKIELCCLNDKCTQKAFKKIVSFFEILEVRNVSDGILTQLIDNGFDTIQKICKVSKEELSKLDGFAKRKTDIVFNAIQSKLTDITLSKLQHASGLFDMLGSKKLLLLEDLSFKFLETDVLPKSSEIVSIDGFSDISASSFLRGLPKFKDFIKDLNVTIRKNIKIEQESNDLEGKVFVFTGYRDKIAEENIIKRGGKIASSISKTTTHLVMKQLGSGSSKEEKALKLGVEILDPSGLNILLS